MNRALVIVVAAVAAGAGCSGRRVSPGSHKDGYGVEASGPKLEDARRAAVSQFFDLYLASPAASSTTLNAEVLDKPGGFIVREKAKTGKDSVELRAVVDYPKLARRLDKLNLVKPEGVRGKPKVLIGLRETGPGKMALGDASAGRASDTMRRRLLERGYTVADNSDGLAGGKQRSGSREETLASARKTGAEVAVVGDAAAEAVPDERLAGYGNCRALLRAEAVSPDGVKIHAAVEQETTSVDVGVPAACAKALENAGEIGADRIAEALSSVFQERVEFTVIFGGLGGLDRTRELLTAVRGLPRVAGAHFDAASGKDVRIKIYGEKMGADDMTAELLKLRQFGLQVRQVDPDFNVIEFGGGDFY